MLALAAVLRFPGAPRRQFNYRPPRFSISVHLLSIVLLLPPAPAARVLVGLAFATLSARSAAAFLRMAVFGPPGGEEGLAVVAPTGCGDSTGEPGRGEDCDWK